MSIKFCHISSTPHLHELTNYNGSHLLLAHLIESDSKYRDFYANLDDDKIKICDNSAFEMYKRGLLMYDSSKLIEMGKATRSDYIVMSDYPGERSVKTIEAAKVLAPQFKSEGFGTFFVPQSSVGDINDLVYAYKWASEHPDIVDYVGVSILGVPNAYGVEKNNRLQRYLSRYHFMGILKQSGILDRLMSNGQKIHFLGMVDGPNEISLVKDYHNYISTWDSSAAVWLGLHANKTFDRSPTGLIDGKYEEEVDFDFVGDDSSIDKAIQNIEYINFLCKGNTL